MRVLGVLKSYLSSEDKLIREIQRTLMELLNQMDGFEVLGQVKMIILLSHSLLMNIGENYHPPVSSIVDKKKPGENDHGNQST